MQILLPSRRKHHTAAPPGAGNGLLNGLSHHIDLGSSILDDIGAGDFTASGTSVSATGAPDGGPSRLFSVGNLLTSAAGNIWNSGSATTLALWFRVETNTGNPYIFGHNAPNGFSSAQAIANDTIWWYFDSTFNGATPTLGMYLNWHLLKVDSTGPGGSDRIFIDGVLKDTGSGGWEPGSSPFYLGGSPAGAGTFVGQMVCLDIWNRLLSTDEDTALYNGGVNLRLPDYTA